MLEQPVKAALIVREIPMLVVRAPEAATRPIGPTATTTSEDLVTTSQAIPPSDPRHPQHEEWKQYQAAKEAPAATGESFLEQYGQQAALGVGALLVAWAFLRK